MKEKLKRIPSIKTVMTAFPYSIETSAPLDEASKMMQLHGIHHLPVTEDGKLIGVLTDRDLRSATASAENSDGKVADVCAREVYSVDRNERLDHVLLHMAKHKIEAAVVLKSDKLAGIFTFSDACRTFAELLRSMFPEGDGDIAA